MWLKRLLKLNQSVPGYGQGSGGMGAGMDAGGTAIFPGQSGLFGGELTTQEEYNNKAKRLRKKKIRERERKWRLSKGQQ